MVVVSVSSQTMFAEMVLQEVAGDQSGVYEGVMVGSEAQVDLKFFVGGALK